MDVNDYRTRDPKLVDQGSEASLIGMTPVFPEGTKYVIDNEDNVWLLVRDGGMVQRTVEQEPGVMSAGTAWLHYNKGPLTPLDTVKARLSEHLIAIPVPRMAPFGDRVIDPSAIQEIWDAFVKPDQERQVPQSIEMRLLMAVLRAVYEGMEQHIANGAQRETYTF